MHGDAGQVEGGNDESRERRGDPRYETDADSVVLIIESRLEIEGRVENLSQSGCRLELARHLQVVAGMHVEVAFQLHREGLRLGGVVQWFDGGRYLGVCFLQVSDRRREALATVIEELAAAEQRCAGRQDAQAEEKNNGCASTQEQAGPVAPVAGEQKEGGKMTVATNGQQAGHEERRQDPRQSLHSVAAIYPIELGGKINAWILNLSLGGCRLQLEGEASIEPQVRLEVGFFYEGLPFRVSGILLGTYGEHEVGIQFVDVSERNHHRLEELIKELEAQRS